MKDTHLGAGRLMPRSSMSGGLPIPLAGSERSLVEGLAALPCGDVGGMTPWICRGRGRFDSNDQGQKAQDAAGLRRRCTAHGVASSR
jgi:hypothetical protein